MDTFTIHHTTPEGGGGQFAPMPEGSQVLVCVDGIYLGKKADQYPGQPVKLVEKYALVFQSEEINPETGKPYEVAREFTLSMNEKAALRKFLGQWRGRSYTEEEAREVPLHKVRGHCGIGTIEHKVSTKGRTYAVLAGIVPLMKGMKPITARDYERGAYWETRKQEYAEGAEAHLRASSPAARAERIAPVQMAGVGAVPAVLADDDDGDSLPFESAAHTKRAPTAEVVRVSGAPYVAGAAPSAMAALGAGLPDDIDDIARAIGYGAGRVVDALDLNDARPVRRARTAYDEGR